jgi:hypothetical protein
VNEPRRNRDLSEFYDVPSAGPVELRGGPYDGDACQLPLSHVDMIRRSLKAPESGPPLTALDAAGWDEYLASRCTDWYYRWNGHVLDDGTRVFALVM